MSTPTPNEGIANHGGRMTFTGPVSVGRGSSAHQYAPPEPGPDTPAGPAERAAPGWADGPGLSGGAVVITAVDCEYRAVAAHLGGPFEERTVSGTLYRLGTFRGRERARRVALAQIGPGNTGAALHVERARTAFAPELIVFAGVAGGLKDVRLGDVVAADAVYDYESAKEGAGEDVWPRARTAVPSHAVVQRAMDVVFRQEWTDYIIDPEPGVAPRAFVKPIAAGGKLLAHADSPTARRVRAFAGDAVAVEMEGYGVLHGASLADHADVLVVRGISDLLTGKDAASDARWQPVAARSAAAFTCAFLDLFTRT
ncbi:5'-methylthioadenosine/S-adenosylhomocysteine nucleosidase family protein [Streptomonospora nanhaiensis]|uniref:Nucleoside phosphorylase n=1 Tax=Streptomonospora nanhaiensis TaxID=1323731 RepID=A0A853BL04_9ACTN|nr:5'-methylthioadenosine/S-adenosylhomocysteine nucleosidase [Streptomonospora nanhaiensis]NYI95241.1 nucleoside phosphorylase [Streptomonospora nanhaiensis]